MYFCQLFASLSWCPFGKHLMNWINATNLRRLLRIREWNKYLFWSKGAIRKYYWKIQILMALNDLITLLILIFVIVCRMDRKLSNFISYSWKTTYKFLRQIFKGTTDFLLEYLNVLLRVARIVCLNYIIHKLFIHSFWTLPILRLPHEQFYLLIVRLD